MDTRILSRFVAVVELGSFNRAAQKLNLSQPALSKSVQLLEERLSAELIKRGPRGVTITPFGQSVYTYAKLIATELRKMDDEIGAMRDLTLGAINFGTSPGTAFTSDVLAKAILRLARKGRRLVINSRVGPRDHLLGPLLLGELDFIVTVLTDTLPAGLLQEQLYEDPLIFVVKQGHPLANRKNVSIHDLVRFAWVVPDESAHESLQRLALSEETAIEQTVIRCNASTLIKALLLSSEFIALVREDMARNDIKNGDYKKLTLSRDLRTANFLGAQQMGLIYRSNSTLSRAGRALVDEIKSLYKPTRA